ncbi:hypothetical protein TUMEXPCC7403_22055 [Tumidithrix helvetica PCC 7403]
MFQPPSSSSRFSQALVTQPAQVCYRHLKLEDLDKPVAGLDYEGHTYSFFKAFSDWAETEKVASRMSDRYVITTTKKGWVIWVFEY